MVTNFTKIIPFFNNSLPFQFELEKYEKIKFTEKKRKKNRFSTINSYASFIA